jgi:hypothetical protein
MTQIDNDALVQTLQSLRGRLLDPSLGARSDDDEKLRRAFLLEDINREQLTLVAGNDAAVAQASNELAKALLVQGRYDEALELATDAAVIQRIQELKEAVLRDDWEECVCGDTIIMNKANRPITLPRYYVAGNIFSPVHLQFVPHSICNVCGHSNVTPTPNQELAQFERVRSGLKPKTPDISLEQA